jgi:glycosyltransferase involved in cell wall biosynthesis
LKIAILCSYPPRFVTNDKFIGAKKTHVSSWNINLISELSNIKKIKIFVLSNGNFFKTSKYIKDNITFIYIARIPILENYIPEIRRRRYQQYLNKIKPDIVHGIGNEHFYPWFAINSGFKNIITIHGILNKIIKNPSIKDQIRIKLEKNVINNAKNIISISDFVKRNIPNKKNKNIFNIPNAIDKSFFNKEFSSTKKEFDLLMVGMIYPLKNTHLIVDVIRELVKTNSQIKIGIIGSYIPKFKKYYDKILLDVHNYQLEKNIIFLGQIENNFLPHYLSKGKVLLHLSKFETGPMVVAEAKTLGLNIIGHNVGAISDMIENKSDILLNSLDINYIVQSILKILQNIKNRNSNIISKVEINKKYHPENISSKTFNAYKEI